MKVISKFLTADVRIVEVRWDDGKVVIEGSVKEFMPMTVELSPDDIKYAVQLLARPALSQLADRLPEPLGSVVSKWIPEEPASPP